MLPPFRIFYIIAFAATWIIGGVGLLLAQWIPGFPPFSSGSPLYYLAAYSVSIAGIYLTVHYDGRDGLRRMLNRALPWRAHISWYTVVIGGYAVMTAAAIHFAPLFHYPQIAIPEWRYLLTGPFVTLALDPGPIGEEFGWRGFALPRLLDRWTPLGATLNLGLAHSLWHLPLFFVSGMSQNGLIFPVFAIGVMSIAIIDTWLYLHTYGNLALAIVVHLMSNFCGGIIGTQSLPLLIAGEAIAALAIVSLGGLKPPGALREVTGKPKVNRPAAE